MWWPNQNHANALAQARLTETVAIVPIGVDTAELQQLISSSLRSYLRSTAQKQDNDFRQNPAHQEHSSHLI